MTACWEDKETVQESSSTANLTGLVRNEDNWTSLQQLCDHNNQLSACSYPSGSRVNPSRKELLYFNNKQNKPAMFAPVTLLMHMDIVRDVADTPAKRRAGCCMAADPKLTPGWVLMADCGKSFQTLISYQVAVDGSIECVSKKTHTDILCLGLGIDEVNYVVHAASSATIQTDVAAAKISASKTNVVDRPKKVNRPATLVYINWDVYKDTDRIVCTPLQTRVYPRALEPSFLVRSRKVSWVALPLVAHHAKQ